MRNPLRRRAADPWSPVTGLPEETIAEQLEARTGPERLLDIHLRTGPHGDAYGARPGGLTLAALEDAPPGIDLGPLEPRLPCLLRTASGKIELAPPLLLAEQARLLVIAGHIHNYERFLQENVVYLVSGGGGAVPYEVDRTPSDLYKGIDFPNYHYVKLTVGAGRLHGEMYRLDESAAPSPHFTLKDTFELSANAVASAFRRTSD